jgi:hypothetical protein
MGARNAGPQGICAAGVENATLTLTRSSPPCFIFPQQLDGLRQMLLVLSVVLDDAETRRQRQALRPDFAHCRQCLEEKATAVLQTATIVVLALIGVSGEEALRQVTVSEVQLQPLKTGR